ncbi:hypothetical protein RO3G_04116 [Rhizopus delemar RA 99-880]|uniref:Uncharacterized protein n=1 Tax=Rhizopus delemar (strain RA 99-880 / ATCC MYA-4621 / FGSC 9543 / NRRL 43880) TaxID=246409 RepID=I1BT81_RHIO9|nr:hypothetical protein RO3G_04116 [Rhizopus delemar RA 99-880]|eukprot:EIE79411.1 hypothetical protein RO3G_04116 [Rhizopus delemar RA 99-880]
MKDLPSIFLEACSGAKIKRTDVFYTSFESLGCLFLDTVTFVFKKGNVLKIMRKENRRYRPSIGIFVDNRLRDATGDQGDEEPFIFISEEDSNIESDKNHTSAPSTAVKKPRTT